MPIRPITNNDIWAAIRGHGMARMSTGELSKFANEHRGKPEFASQVIVKAASSYIALRHTLAADQKRKSRRN